MADHLITGRIDGDREIVEYLERNPEMLRAALKVGIGRAVLRLQREVKENKLDGQVLRRISSRLERSINTKVADSADGVEGTVGTNVEYARPHEFGFKGVVTVREHLRKVKEGSRFNVRNARQGPREALREAVASSRKVMVRAHDRHVDMPERSFLRSALRDLAPALQAEVNAAVITALKGSLKARLAELSKGA